MAKNVKTVAVTGGSGFIGRRLIEELLALGVRIKALQNSTPIMQHPHIVPVKGPITDKAVCQELLEGVDAVVHIAGLVAALSAKAFHAVNVVGTQTLAEVAAKNNVKFLFYSSLSAREPNLSDYGHSKYMAEKALAKALPLGWDVFRPTAVYGPGDRQFLELVKMVQKKAVYLPASPRARASLIYVDDLIAATVLWLKTNTPQQKTYDLHDGASHGYTWLEVVYAMAHTGTVPKVKFLPKFVTWSVAYISLFLQVVTRNTSFLPPEKMKQLTHLDWVTQDQSFMQEYSWQAQTKPEVGFKKAIAWYKEQKLL